MILFLVAAGDPRYEYVYGFCVENSGKFKKDSDVCYGKMTEDELVINGISFNRICNDGGYNPDAIIGWLDKEGMLIKGNDGKRKKQVKINGHNTRCVCIDLKKNKEQENNADWLTVLDQEKLPFK